MTTADIDRALLQLEVEYECEIEMRAGADKLGPYYAVRLLDGDQLARAEDAEEALGEASEALAGRRESDMDLDGDMYARQA